MAKRYAKLKTVEFTCESKPVEGLTEQKWNDSLYVIRGEDEGIPTWYYILVPYYKIDQQKNVKLGQTIDCNQFGSLIKYRDNNGESHVSSGWGTNPPKSFQTWIEDHYGDRSFDEDTKMTYESDDIRLCTMQRETSSQLIGIYQYYNKQNSFHYIKLFDNSKSNLAYRSGIRNFDRLICLNGINIEHDTLDQLKQRFQNQTNLSIEMLVCNPTTYQYYKQNNIIIHQHLPTVQHFKPGFHISISNQSISLQNQSYYVIQWESNNLICVRHQSTDSIEIEQNYPQGKILFKGSKDQCQNIRNDLIKNIISLDYFKSNDQTLLSEQNKILSDKSLLNETFQFEDLPNELLFDLFNYLSIEDLHNCFSNLNNRLNNLLLSRYNVSLIYNDHFNSLLIKFYGFEINHLIIDTSKEIYLNLFTNLNSLIILNRNLNLIKQIQPEIFANLRYLSFELKFDFKPPIELINQIFSYQFPSLRYVNLGLIEKSFSNRWSTNPFLEIISICCEDLSLIVDILLSCPNLKDLQINLLNNFNLSIICSSTFIHSLQRFTLFTQQIQLKLNLIDNILSFIPNLQYFYLQTNCQMSFIYFIENTFQKLNHLIRFDCFIKELLTKTNRIGNLNDIHQICPSFKRIQLVKENEDYRIFATE